MATTDTSSVTCQDAVKYMDGEKIDGQKVSVARAENRPPIRSLGLESEFVKGKRPEGEGNVFFESNEHF